MRWPLVSPGRSRPILGAALLLLASLGCSDRVDVAASGAFATARSALAPAWITIEPGPGPALISLGPAQTSVTWSIAFDTNVQAEIDAGVYHVEYRDNGMLVGTATAVAPVTFTLGYGEHLLTLQLVDASGQPLGSADTRDGVHVFVTRACSGPGPSGCQDDYVCNHTACVGDAGKYVCAFSPDAPAGCCHSDDDCPFGHACDLAQHLCIECATDLDCADTSACSVDMCNAGVCAHVGTCCTNSDDCPDDGNHCTYSTCTPTSGGFSTCGTITISPCTTCPPWVETWSGAAASPGGIADYGWEVWSAPSATSDASGNWRLSHTGTLGPDAHLTFNRAPSRVHFNTCLVSPLLDTTGSSPCWQGIYADKPNKDLTLQFESDFGLVSPDAKLWVFAYEGGGDPPIDYPAAMSGPDAVLLETMNGAVQNTSWAKRLETLDLSDSVHYGSTKTRIAFCIQADTTADLDHFSIDKVTLNFGKPFVWGHSCPDPPQSPDECFGSSPPPAAVTATLGEAKEVLLTAARLDLKATYLEHPTFSIRKGPAHASLKYSLPFYNFIGLGTFYNYLVIDGSDPSLLGDHEVDLVVSEDLLEDRATILVHQILGSGYVIWQPADATSHSGKELQAAIASYGGRPTHLVSTLDNYDLAALRKLDGVFVVLGSRGANHVLTSAEAAKLRDYLLGGGHLYLEGGETWADDPQTPLHRMFRAVGVRGSTPVTSALVGRNRLASGSTVAVNQWLPGPVSPFHNAFVDALVVTPGEGSFPLLREGPATSAPVRNVMVGYDGRAGSPLATYRTVASALSFSALSPVAAATSLGRDVVLRRIVDFFEGGSPTCSACDASFPDGCQCDDDDPCTTTTCGPQGVCVSTSALGCTPCATDDDCAADEACRMADGKCVSIPGIRVRAVPLLGLDTVPGSAVRNIALDPCPGAGSNQLAAVAVKVRINHTWRGQVAITLIAPDGTNYPLRVAAPADDRFGLYETYDVGVDSGNTPLSGAICVPGSPWTVRIEDMLPGADSGLVDEVALYFVPAPL